MDRLYGLDCARFKLDAVVDDIMAAGLKIWVVVDNSASAAHPRLMAQHGLSLLLEVDLGPEKMNILMDTGSSPEVTLHNLDLLELDAASLDAIFLSHGHYDHTGGLLGVLRRAKRRIPILAHPDIFSPKLKGRPYLKSIGPPYSRSEAEAAGAVFILTTSPVSLAEGVTTTGEVERIEAFEKAEGFWTVKEGRYSEDLMPDDQSMIIDVEGKGLTVVSGCAHAGIVNTIRHAQKITGIEEVYAIVGGFHLMGADRKRIASTAEALVSLDPKIVRPGHCTGSEAVRALRDALGDRCQPLATGDLF